MGIAVWAAYAIRLGQWWPTMLERSQLLFLIAIGVSLPIFVFLGYYRSVLRYAGQSVIYTIVQGASLSVLCMIAIWVVIQGAYIPRSAWFIYWFVLIAMTGGSRLLLREYLRKRFVAMPSGGAPVLIYGAGVAGVQLASALQHDQQFEPVAFIDDNKDIVGSEIVGLKVYAHKNMLKLVKRKHIETILLAIPSASRRRRREILNELAPLPVQVMIIPSLTELANGKKRVDDLRAVDLEDILGRDSIAPNDTLLTACIRNKVVMITGAGGSIGSELCRQILQQHPRRIVLFELSEYALYNIERELRTLSEQLNNPPELIPILGSVNHRNRVQAVIETFAVQTVYHAAAYKHVPIVEHNPIEGVQNNIFGTLFAAQAAIAAGTETFVLVSTDKAVRPTNVMGATKRFAELVLQGLAQQKPTTHFCTVRFGNVLASSGSVVPLFREQIRQGGPVTVTHPDITRYFMTVQEAAQLVIQAGAMANGGGVFILDMHEPVNITLLARRLIELSGFEVRDESNPDGDIEIQFTGLRPGEKLYEELLISPNDQATAHPMIRRAMEESLPWATVDNYLQRLELASKNFNYYEVRAVLLEAVKGYQPECGIEDWVWVERGDSGAA